MNRKINIAIDGPSGAGKSTLAKAIAKELGIIYVDTGALYRSIGLYAARNGVSLDNVSAVTELLCDIELSLVYEDGNQQVILNGERVGDKIRTPEISMYASAVSAVPEVRAFLLGLQKDMAKNNSVIMDGRDIGTVILPDADVKIFLTASVEARAKRRYKELCEKGVTTTYEEVLSDMKLRDENDSTRAVAPAIPAPDATLFDNSNDDVESTVNKIKALIEVKLGYAL